MMEMPFNIKNQDETSPEESWRLIGLIILSIRFVQGWIFWGGGSRRFIYDPSKLDPYSTDWMANKLQSAIPGALLGFNHILSYVLQHFILLYIAIIIFSLIELICGLSLLIGFMTRIAGFITALISIILMLLFGWQGATCMDEWTMAATSLAIGLTLTVSGAPVYSIDHILERRSASMRRWLILPPQYIKSLSLIFLFFTIVFTLVTYNYLRGSIISPYHSGPVSAAAHHLTLSEGQFTRDGLITFNINVNAGTTATPAYVIRIELDDRNGNEIEAWDGAQLAGLSKNSIKNTFAYNQITIGTYGLIAPTSAIAKITLKSSVANLHISSNQLVLKVYCIDGKRYDLIINSLAAG